jgi:hypothetical protein
VYQYICTGWAHAQGLKSLHCLTVLLLLLLRRLRSPSLRACVVLVACLT